MGISKSHATVLTWEQIVSDTLQLGGRIVLIADSAPSDLNQWVKSAQEAGCPVVVLSVQDLIKKCFLTSAEDLILTWQAEHFRNPDLNAVLCGQRVLIAVEKGLDGSLVDFNWPQMSLDKWSVFFSKFLNSTRPLFNPCKLFPQNDPRPCLFLDRDDVIVENVPYNNDPAQVRLRGGIGNLINQAHSKNYWVAMVSNQSGLARGRITWAQYQQVHQQMLKLLAAQGAWIDECVWSGALPDSVQEAGRFYLGQRKPRVGLFQQVEKKLGVDFARSVMVGDSASDLIAAYGVGIRKLYLVETQKVEQEREKLADFKKEFQNFIFQSIKEYQSLSL
jgi:histidinol-phosphate phosphatase family protein